MFQFIRKLLPLVVIFLVFSLSDIANAKECFYGWTVTEKNKVSGKFHCFVDCPGSKRALKGPYNNPGYGANQLRNYCSDKIDRTEGNTYKRKY